MATGVKRGGPTSFERHFRHFLGSVWLFPIILLVPLIIFTALKISGSSIGAMRDYLYNPSTKDPALVVGKPESIRSDEWLVNTQMTIAQSKANFPRINKNIGNGEDMTVMSDVPARDWSQFFRPQNLAFFVLPLENAFAFKWWLMAYLLMVSCYFFILALLPNRRLLAACLSTAFFFSAFIQWWYSYGTLGPLYYSLFIAITVMFLCRQKSLRLRLFSAAALAYLVTCFALVLYPPFQIACALVVLAFVIGYGAMNYQKWGRPLFVKNCLWLIGSTLAAAVISGAFIFTRMDVIKSIEHTVYPGHRSANSGRFFPEHFLSSQLGHQFLSDKNTMNYLIDGKKGHTNQSEASDFLLLSPFLLLPALLLVGYEWRRKLKIDWLLLVLNLLFVIFLLNLFAPAFTPVAHLLFLGQVADARLLIGVGLLNLMILIVFIRNFSKSKIKIPKLAIVLYSLAVLAVNLVVDYQAHENFSTFVGQYKFILFSLPIPIIIYLLLSKRFFSATAVYLAFSLYIALGVNPLYRGLGTATKNPLSLAIQQVGANSTQRWASDGGYLENFALMNGQRSLSGVYEYPQFSLWNKIPGADSYVYNRYAHVGVEVFNNPAQPTKMKLVTTDSFVVQTNACSDYLRQENIGFLISSAVLDSPCAKVVKTVSLPIVTLYIYKIN